MEAGLIFILGLGLLLGIKHAIEPDHVIAVSTIASQSKTLWKSSLAGVFWGLGHTATLFVVGMIFIISKGEIPEIWALSLEFLVGVMLVYFGVTSIRIHIKTKVSEIGINHRNRSYITPLLMGFVHGLAGSGAMIVLTMSTVNSVWEGSLYIIVFGVGTVIGMLFFTTLIGIPFVLSVKRKHFNKLLIQITGVISTAFGIYYMYNLGIIEGLFKLWIQAI